MCAPAISSVTFFWRAALVTSSGRAALGAFFWRAG